MHISCRLHFFHDNLCEEISLVIYCADTYKHSNLLGNISRKLSPATNGYVANIEFNSKAIVIN